MSFILDAIANSEQERQQQEVPSAQILALPAGSAKQPRRVLPYLVVGALLLNAALLVIWMQSDQTFLSNSSPTPADNIDRPNLQATVSGNVSVEDGAASVEVTDNTATAKVATEIGNIEPVNDSRAELPNETLVTQDIAAGPVSKSETVTGEDTTSWERIEPDSLSDKTSSEQQIVRNTDVLQAKVSRLSELPRALRNDLPTVVFSGHLYSSDPKSSLVFVDGGRPVRKGRKIAKDLFLYEITPTGVIVEFRGYLIDVGVLQNWTLN